MTPRRWLGAAIGMALLLFATACFIPFEEARYAQTYTISRVLNLALLPLVRRAYPTATTLDVSQADCMVEDGEPAVPETVSRPRPAGTPERIFHPRACRVVLSAWPRDHCGITWPFNQCLAIEIDHRLLANTAVIATIRQVLDDPCSFVERHKYEDGQLGDRGYALDREDLGCAGKPATHLPDPLVVVGVDRSGEDVVVVQTITLERK